MKLSKEEILFIGHKTEGTESFEVQLKGIYKNIKFSKRGKTTKIQFDFVRKISGISPKDIKCNTGAKPKPKNSKTVDEYIYSVLDKDTNKIEFVSLYAEKDTTNVIGFTYFDEKLEPYLSGMEE